MIPQCVVFDAVGTVMVPWPAADVVYTAAAARFGITVDPGKVRDRFHRAFAEEEARDAVGEWRVDEARERERWRRIVAEVLPGSSDACFQDLYDYFARPASWHVSADATAVIRFFLQRPVQLGIASNLDARLHPILAGHPELAPLSRCVIVSSEIGYRKPHPEFYHHIVRGMNCQPREILYVGDDRRNDYDGARNAGLQAVLLDPKERHLDVPERITRLTELVERFSV